MGLTHQRAVGRPASHGGPLLRIRGLDSDRKVEPATTYYRRHAAGDQAEGAAVFSLLRQRGGWGTLAREDTPRRGFPRCSTPLTVASPEGRRETKGHATLTARDREGLSDESVIAGSVGEVILTV